MPPSADFSIGRTPRKAELHGKAGRVAGMETAAISSCDGRDFRDAHGHGGGTINGSLPFVPMPTGWPPPDGGQPRHSRGRQSKSWRTVAVMERDDAPAPTTAIIEEETGEGKAAQELGKSSHSLTRKRWRARLLKSSWRRPARRLAKVMDVLKKGKKWTGQCCLRCLTASACRSPEGRIAAIPPAPAATGRGVLESYTTKASTGILHWQAWRNASRPRGRAASFSRSAQTARSPLAGVLLVPLHTPSGRRHRW